MASQTVIPWLKNVNLVAIQDTKLDFLDNTTGYMSMQKGFLFIKIPVLKRTSRYTVRKQNFLLKKYKEKLKRKVDVNINSKGIVALNAYFE